MKNQFVIVFILLLGCTKPDNETGNANSQDSVKADVIAQAVGGEPNVEKKISPNELATLIADVLEELRPTLEGESLVFSKAELEIAAKKDFSVEGELSVKVFKASLSTERETSVTVTYQLSDPLSLAKKETAALKRLEGILNQASPQDVNSRKLQLLRSIELPEESELTELKGKNTLQEVSAVIQKTKSRRAEARRYVDTKSMLVKTVLQTIDDYKVIKEKFKQTCFDVKIAFSVVNKASLEVDIEFLGAEGSKSNTWEHSLTLSFGKCD